MGTRTSGSVGGQRKRSGSKARHRASGLPNHSRVRDELLDIEEFSCLAEARVVISDWQEDYNWRRPHSALGMRAPAVFAAAVTPPAATGV